MENTEENEKGNRINRNYRVHINNELRNLYLHKIMDSPV